MSQVAAAAVATKRIGGPAVAKGDKLFTVANSAGHFTEVTFAAEQICASDESVTPGKLRALVPGKLVAGILCGGVGRAGTSGAGGWAAAGEDVVAAANPNSLAKYAASASGEQ